MKPSLPCHLACLVLLAGLMTGPALLAQEAATRITGSAIIEPLLQAMAGAAGVEGEVRIETTGSRTGLAQLCASESGLSTSTQPISEEQLQACADSDIVPAEFTLGHGILALITHSINAEFVTCLDDDQLANVFAPSAADNITHWNQIVADAPETLALTVYAPDELGADFILLDALVRGDGLRADARPTRDPLAAVAAEAGAIAVTTLQAAQGQHILALDSANSDGCRAPSAANVEDGLYPAARPLLLYVNTALVNQPAVQALLELVASDAAAGLVASAGFTPPTERVVEINRDRLQAALRGEAAPPGQGSYNIPAGLSGALRVGGSAMEYEFAGATRDSLQAASPGVTTTLALTGTPAAFRELCDGALDLMFSGRMPLAGELDACATNGIEHLTLPLGNRALVLLASGHSEAPACLTTAQSGAIWRAESAGTLMRWSDLDATFPDEALTLFAPQPGSPQLDMLLAASAAGLTGRHDIEMDDDALYRAAATANVPGALTFMSWAEYQQVLENGQERIRLMALDAGAGCVSPSPASIRDGSWPLGHTTLLTVNRSRLNLPAVQSFLWHLASEENFSAWEAAGFADVRLSDLHSLQNALVNAFDEAAIAALQRMEEQDSDAEGEAEAAG